MKNNTVFTLVGVMIVLGILACNVTINSPGLGETVRGSGTVIEENRNLSNISGVELTMPGMLYIEMGSSETFRIEAEDNLLEHIQTDVQAGRLVIRTREGVNLQATRPIKYYLTVKELDTILVSSSGDVEAGDLQSETFKATSTSSGNISIGKLDCTSLRVEISSSGDISISELMGESTSVRISSSGDVEIGGGQVQQQDIDISSSGKYRAGELESANAEVNLTSSGTATLRVSDHLSGNLSSSGDIHYIGSPDVNVRTTSSGKAVQTNK